MSLPQPSPLTPDPLLHSPDPFLLITRIPTHSSNPNSPLLRAQARSPVPSDSSHRFLGNESVDPEGPKGMGQHLRSFSRCWTLLAITPLDLAYGVYYTILVTHLSLIPSSPSPTLPSSELIPLLALAILRPIILFTVSLTRGWRKRMGWVVIGVIGTMLGVAWEVNWLVQVKEDTSAVRDVFGGIGWFLIWQTTFATLEYLLYLLPLRLSPISPYPPPPSPARQHRRFGFRKRALSNAKRRQREVGLNYSEEEVQIGEGGSGDKGKGKARAHRRQDSRTSLRWADEGSERGSRGGEGGGEFLSPREGGYERRLSASPEEEERGNSGEESIGRYSDEGEEDVDSGSDSDSISSNEIVDLPPPNRPASRSASMVIRASHSDLRIRTGLRNDGQLEEGFRSSGSFTQRGLGRPGSPLDLAASPEEDEEVDEEDERERQRSSETRLERGLSKRWRSAKGFFKGKGKGKGKSGSGSGSGAGDGSGEYGTFNQ